MSDEQPTPEKSLDEIRDEYSRTLRRELVRDIVLCVRLGCRFKLLDLNLLVQQYPNWNPEFLTLSVSCLQTSFPWRNQIPGWYALRDHAVKIWPADGPNIRREMSGLLDVLPSDL